MFRELFSEGYEEIIAVFPNLKPILSMLSKNVQRGFCFEVVLACHHACDLACLIMELLGRFATNQKYITKVYPLCTLPEGTFRQYTTQGYIVRLCSDPGDGFEVSRDCRQKERDELFTPKAVYAQDEFREVINDKRSPLANFKVGTNKCVDIDDSKNGKAISFSLVVAAISIINLNLTKPWTIFFRCVKNFPSVCCCSSEKSQ